MNRKKTASQTNMPTYTESHIAILLYEIAHAKLSASDITIIENTFSDCLKIAADNIIRSERTKEKMLISLQRKKVGKWVKAFWNKQKDFPENYFIDRFSTVISLRNSRKISPLFVNLFLDKLATDEELCRIALNLFTEPEIKVSKTKKRNSKKTTEVINPIDEESVESTIKSEASKIIEEEVVETDQSDFIEEETVKEESVANDAESIEAKVDEIIEEEPIEIVEEIALDDEDAAFTALFDDTSEIFQDIIPETENETELVIDEFEEQTVIEQTEVENTAVDNNGATDTVLKRQTGSAQMVFWDPSKHVLPVRGLRNLEALMREHNLLCVTGFAGCGKSLLISGYIYQQVFNRSLAIGNVFYYRYSQHQSEFDVFLNSLATFLNIDTLDEAILIEKVASKITASSAIFVLDDFQNFGDKRYNDLIQKCWKSISESEKFSGKFIILSRELPTFESHQNAAIYHYEGLTTAESSALLKDLWKMDMPRLVARSVSQKLNGNPVRLNVFRHWYENELHTDTEIDRFVREIPTSDNSDIAEKELSFYVLEYLYNSFEAADSRINSFCKSISILRGVMPELFMEKLYAKIGGGDFQIKLETLVEKYNFVDYDVQNQRYVFQETLRQFYEKKLAETQLKRSLENLAGSLYEDLFNETEEISAVVNGANHYFAAEREIKALTLISKLPYDVKLKSSQTYQLRTVMESIPERLIDNDEMKLNYAYNLAKLYYHDSSWTKAEKYFLQSFAITHDDAQISSILFSLGEINTHQGRLADSNEWYQKALAKYQELNNAEGIAKSHLMIGENYLFLEDTETAKEYFQEALTMFTKLDNVDGQHRANQELGHIALQNNETDNAIEYFSRTLRIDEKRKSFDGMAYSLLRIGSIYDNLQEPDAAINAYQRVIDNTDELTHISDAADANRALGNIHLRLKNLVKSSEFYSTALSIYESIQNINGLANVYENLGRIHHQKRNWDKAMDFYRRAQQFYEQNNDEISFAEMYAQMGRVYTEINENERALTLFEKALSIQEKYQDAAGISRLYEEIGDINLKVGKDDYAMDVYKRALMLNEQGNYPRGIAEVSVKIAHILQKTGQLSDAAQLYSKSLTIFLEMNNAAGIARTHQLLGIVYHELQDLDLTKSHFVEALSAYEKEGNVNGMAEVNYNLGNLYHDLGDWQKAINRYETALPLFMESGDFLKISQLLGNTSSIEFEQKNHAAAIRKQIEILLFFHQSQQSDLLEKVLSNLVSCHEDLGHETFQMILDNCLMDVSRSGVVWGEHELLTPDEASGVIDIFFNNN